LPILGAEPAVRGNPSKPIGWREPLTLFTLHTTKSPVIITCYSRNYPEELESGQAQIDVAAELFLLGLSQSDEASVCRVHDTKKDQVRVRARETLVFRLPRNLRPIVTIQGALENRRFEILSADWGLIRYSQAEGR
jgi:hypothetical protein